ncbi:MAG: hypothetical protein RL287_835 [Actinomycetota bacterium]
MRPTPYVASLRIYEPIDAFTPADQLRWNSIPLDTHTGNEEELRALQRVVLAEPPTNRADGAHIIDHNGKRFISPWSTAQRCWAALEDFKTSLPSSVIPYFLPESLADSLSILDSDVENKVPHIISETWMIPPRWFALFVPEERLRGTNEDGAFTIMRTHISNAKKRCIDAHAAVREAFGPGPVEEELIQLLNWLNVFHPQSIVECDYGGLAVYLEQSIASEGDAGLESDTSIEDVELSLQGLSSGDGALAGQGYERLVKRWRKVAAFEQAM